MKNKNPWERTKKDWMDNQPAGERNAWIKAITKSVGVSSKATSIRGKSKYQKAARKAAKQFDEMFDNKHKKIVQQALVSGKVVPVEVLIDYPDLII